MNLCDELTSEIISLCQRGDIDIYVTTDSEDVPLNDILPKESLDFILDKIENNDTIEDF